MILIILADVTLKCIASYTAEVNFLKASEYLTAETDHITNLAVTKAECSSGKTVCDIIIHALIIS